MKKVSLMSMEERQFVLRLLHMTKNDFERAFLELSKSDTQKGMRRFTSYWCSLAELAYTDQRKGFKDYVNALYGFFRRKGGKSC